MPWPIPVTRIKEKPAQVCTTSTFISILSKNPDAVIKTEKISLPEVCHLQHLSFIEELLMRALDTFKSINGKCIDMANIWLTSVLDEILRQNNNNSTSGTDLHHLEITEKVRSLIDECPGKDFHVNDFAKSKRVCLPNISTGSSKK